MLSWNCWTALDRLRLRRTTSDTFRGAKPIRRFLTRIASEVLRMTIELCAIDIAVADSAAVFALRDDHGFFLIDLDANAFIEYIAFAIEIFSASFGILAIRHDAAFELCHVIEAFFE